MNHGLVSSRAGLLALASSLLLASGAARAATYYVYDSSGNRIAAIDGNALTAPAVSAAGVVFAFAGKTCPPGSLLADGSAVSRAQYQRLFTALDPQPITSTTFFLPDLRGQFIRGTVGVSSKTFLPGAVNLTTDVITVPNHGFLRSGFPIRFSSTGTLPGGLSPTATYWAIVLTPDTFKVAATEANAVAPTPVAIDLVTSTGTNVHTVIPNADPDAATRTAPMPGGRAGDVVGSVEADQTGAHRHGIPGTGGTASGVGDSYATNSWDGGAWVVRRTTQALYDIGSETRPRNVGLLYCIQY